VIENQETIRIESRKEDKKMKGKGFTVLTGSLFLTALLVLLGLAKTDAAAGKPIELNWVSFTAKSTVTVINIQRDFIDRVNKSANGELIIKYRGGPETIAAFDQGRAVKKGSVDISAVPIGFYEAIVPGVGGAMLTQLTPEEERKPGGAYDYMVEIHKKGGLFYLGRGTPSRENFFYLNLNKMVEKPQDFVGLKLGTATVARAAVKGWGATVVSLAMPEYYTSMERGLVDGVASAGLSAWVGQGCQAVTKYLVDHPYYQSTVAMIMNLNSWDRLPPHLQKVMMDSMIQAEKDLLDWYGKDIVQLKQKMVDGGVKIYKFSPDMAKWFLETAYNSAWQYQEERFPEVTRRLQQLMTKPSVK
jgi:TRAP-type C4-dicarboxylate transport system substrate-binding protein